MRRSTRVWMADWLALDRASQRAWPALITERYDGWVLRYARGYTRRANSITPLVASSLPLARKVACCQRRYVEQGIEPVFRIVDRGPAFGVDAWLAAAGWGKRDPTLVLCRPLDSTTAEARLLAAADDVDALGIEDWIDAFVRITCDGREQGPHREMLWRVATHSLRLMLQRDGQPVGCALAVLRDGWLSLLDVAVVQAWRRQGLGSLMLQRALAWGAAQGAVGAVLSVTATNKPARALYARLGFTASYAYWYRHPPI